MAKLIIGMIVCTVVVIIVLAGVDSFTGGFVNNSNNSEYVDDENTLEVSVLGEVNKTGTYLLPLDSTLADLLDAAGKVTGNADPKAFDTSVILEDKDSFYIAPLFDQNDVCATEPIRKVCINTASKSELSDVVSAFSDSVSQAIVDYRNTNGAYTKLEDLYDVPGIGPATFEKCKNFVTLRE